MMIWLFYLGNIPQKKWCVFFRYSNEDVPGIPYQLFINPFLITDSEWPVIFSNRIRIFPFKIFKHAFLKDANKAHRPRSYKLF